MTVRAFDVARYGALLKEAHPTVPRNEKENQRLLDLTAGLMNRELSREERELLEVLLALIQRFEDDHYALAKASPHETLREMMRARDVTPKDLYHVFGSKGTTSEALRGKRSISKNAARQLAEIFHVGMDRFL